MSRPQLTLNLAELRSVAAAARLKRRINAVHIHFGPRAGAQPFRGHATLELLYREESGSLTDFAAHLLIGPDGSYWLGRAWNFPPASAKGANGAGEAGPFALRLIASPDGQAFSHAQMTAAAAAVAALSARSGGHGLPLLFDWELIPSRQPPPLPLSTAEFVKLVDEARAELSQGSSVSNSPVSSEEDREYPIEATKRVAEDPARRVSEALVREAVARVAAQTEWAGRDEGDAPGLDYAINSGQEAARAERQLGAEELSRLRPYAINLRGGRLVEGGAFHTLPGDVDVLVKSHLHSAWEEARREERPFRIMIWAHGGLVDEKSGLSRAATHVDWWRENGVYPIYFVWEAGLFDALGSLLRSGDSRLAARGWVSDRITDPFFEALARRLGGEKIWSAMKQNAFLCSQEANGGAHYFARQLAEWLNAEKRGPVEIHAAGHSAGAVFQSWLMPELIRLKVRMKTLHLLAPAVRTDEFKERILPLMQNDAFHSVIYTMSREQELDDHCANVYRKSLLYLIHHALESERKAPLLGLEVSLVEDAALRTVYGLDRPRRENEVVFSKTTHIAGPRASQSTSHGGFDDDPATMNSIALDVLGLRDPAELVRPYRKGQARGLWAESDDDDDALPSMVPMRVEGVSRSTTGSGQRSSTVSNTMSNAPIRMKVAGGARRGLCIGIDAYPTAPLGGCVADAELWANLFRGLDFDVQLITDERRTEYEPMRDAIARFVEGGRSGDSLVLHYSGHGTFIPDEDRDETGTGQNPPDEAICPIDFHTGALLVDDEIAGILSRVQTGVNLTLFIDCCHSGDMSRFAVGTTRRPAGANPRFIRLDAPTMERHRRLRRSRGGAARSGLTRDSRPENVVVFSACRDDEVAWESEGQGEFTVRAVRILKGGVAGLTNAGFSDRVVREFGEVRRQTPQLDCRTSRLDAPLLFGFAGPPGADTLPAPPTGARADPVAVLADGFEAMARALRRP